ncbi:MAG: UDP-N-acetylmuramoyl-L-alanine--D-glutamate ligase [Planctomycetaceae bacterium]
MLADFHDLRVTVMGLGTFGGGVGAVRFLTQRGALVTVTDLRPADDLLRSLALIADAPRVTLHLGGHAPDDFRDCDLVVVSPAIPRQSPFLEIARNAGIAITSEMNLFWERNPGRTICVTGSSGKSTTAALLHAILSAAANRSPEDRPPETGEARPAQPDSASPRCWLGGNIGASLLPSVGEIRRDDWVVVELSSFQLEDLAPLKPDPEIAIVTNFTPNHLDRHGTLDEYRRAKQGLLRWQTPDHAAILNQNDADVAAWPTAARKFWFGRDDEGRQGLFAIGFEGYKRRALYRMASREQVLPLGDWLSLPGVHNLQNALAATCAALVLETPVPQVAVGLSSFHGLPHRLELVAETAGRRFINDSKATTPAAAMLGLDAFRAPLVLLAGGSDKGVDLADLAQGIVARGVKAVALLGQTADTLYKLIKAADPQGRIKSKTHVTFDAAFDWAAAQSSPGDVVLLSPGCASYDWFENYEARGEAFARRARGWSPSE